ncbi:MAG TPA: hypothetical protein VNJ08_04230 [Bacteriovoracaceae bacterium]|nr:hypothetical protein [Bacteriovoracaceae bacterium]
MVYLLAIALGSLLSVYAQAEPIPNISGITGRLETIKCEGGHYLNKADVNTNVYQKADIECNDLPADQFEICLGQVIKANTTFVSSAFLGAAIEGKKQFNMTIMTTPAGKKLFNSLRDGTHGDGEDGTLSLLFSRVGNPGDDYMIETGTLSYDAKSVPMLIVPVKRRVLADLIYFFFDCKLDWKY